MIHRFGVFEFDAGSGELRKQGRLARLEPQPARALARLLETPGEIVSRDEMRARIWDDGTHVDFDRGLAYCFSQVRTALGDSADNPRFIETVPKRGFKFIAPVSVVEVQGGSGGFREVRGGSGRFGASGESPAAPAVTERLEAASRSAGLPRAGWWGIGLAVAALAAAVWWTGWAGVAGDRPLVAVAMFDNETGSPAFDRLAASAADVAVERLTALGPDRIGVIGNTPSLRTAREARTPSRIRIETGAGYLVIGQVQNDDGGVRLLVHLIRLDDDTHLWVTRVVRPAEALGDIEDVATARLVEAVQRHVIDRDPNAPRSTR
jgi:DNA-binding winged helix-turn-helix (wHTH) protein/TolB-like protein